MSTPIISRQPDVNVLQARVKWFSRYLSQASVWLVTTQLASPEDAWGHSLAINFDTVTPATAWQPGLGCTLIKVSYESQTMSAICGSRCDNADFRPRIDSQTHTYFVYITMLSIFLLLRIEIDIKGS